MLQSASLDIWAQKYQLKDKDGNPIDQSIDDTFKRVCKALAACEDDPDYWSNQFYWAMRNGALPGGRIMANAGAQEHKPSTSTINCTVSGHIYDSMDSIMERAKEAALTLKAGCGIGYEFSTLRPNGALVKGSNSTTTGPLPFMDMFDALCKTVSSAGGRRGAQMATFDIRHPDVIDVIKAKREAGRLRQFNISLLLTDEFMRAATRGDKWDLRYPLDNGTVYKTVQADWLLDLIMQSTYDYSEPGVLFIDRINKMNNLEFCEDIRATNPCFTGSTKVWTDKGLIPFSVLAESGESVNVLTQNDNNELVYRKMVNPRMTQKNVELVRVVFTNGTSITCTPNHVFFLKNGEKTEAKDLKHDDRIWSVYRYKANSKGYLRLTNGHVNKLEHHIPFECIPKGFNVHHVNGIKTDNSIDNLVLMDRLEHSRIHMQGDNNPMIKHPERNWLPKQNWAGSNNGRYRHDIDDNIVRKLRSEGKSFNAIAKMIGCSKYTIEHRLGYKRPDNHTVLSVEFLNEKQDVYCGTVPDTGRFFVAVDDNEGVLVSNCGEQPLPPFGACLLGSIDLTKFVAYPFQSDAGFDFKTFRAVARVFTRMLDNVVDLHGLPLFEQADELMLKRRHGMGVTGLGSTLAMLGVRYGSDEAVGFVDDLMSDLALAGWEEGLELAKTKGPAPIFNDLTDYLVGKEYFSFREMFTGGPYMQQFNYELLQGIIEHGCRFTHHTSIAPTGTLSLSFGNNCSNGIEPSFAHHYTRNVIKDGRKTKEAVDVWSAEAWEWNKLYPNKSFPDHFVTADTVPPLEHLYMQAAAQKWVDSSISKTINCPSSIPFNEFKNIYINAWEMGCKGCTTFRFNPDTIQGVLVKKEDAENTIYRFTLADGSLITAKGTDIIKYDGQEHTALNLYDALKDGYYGRL